PLFAFRPSAKGDTRYGARFFRLAICFLAWRFLALDFLAGWLLPLKVSRGLLCRFCRAAIRFLRDGFLCCRNNRLRIFSAVRAHGARSSRLLRHRRRQIETAEVCDFPFWLDARF